MKGKPILMCAEMVRATLDGSKTQTRRIVKRNASGRVELRGRQWHIEDDNATLGNPYGQPGDRLWVRETFALTDEYINYEPGYVFRATDPDWSEMEGFKWKPSIFMPRLASRITLEIVAVRVERLQDIDDADARAEGCCGVASTQFGVPNFRYVWESINGSGSWEKNPWVWVVEFKRIQAKE